MAAIAARSVAGLRTEVAAPAQAGFGRSLTLRPVRLWQGNVPIRMLQQSSWLHLILKETSKYGGGKAVQAEIAYSPPVCLTTATCLRQRAVPQSLGSCWNAL